MPLVPQASSSRQGDAWTVPKGLLKEEDLVDPGDESDESPFGSFSKPLFPTPLPCEGSYSTAPRHVVPTKLYLTPDCQTLVSLVIDRPITRTHPGSYLFVIFILSSFFTLLFLLPCLLSALLVVFVASLPFPCLLVLVLVLLRGVPFVLRGVIRFAFARTSLASPMSRKDSGPLDVPCVNVRRARSSTTSSQACDPERSGAKTNSSRDELPCSDSSPQSSTRRRRERESSSSLTRRRARA